MTKINNKPHSKNIFFSFQSLGNHEFDERVYGLTPFIHNLTTPVLCANLVLDDVPELQDEDNLYDSIVLKVNGIQIGIIGYLTPETQYLAPRNKVKYEDEVIAIRREVSKLKESGVNILIALGHSGYVRDLNIAKEVEDIDLVIGGHSNTFLSNVNSTEIPEEVVDAYPKTVTQQSGRKVLVVQAYAFTKYMGRLHLIFNSDGEIEQFDGEPVLLNNDIPRDPDMLNLLAKYREQINKITSNVIGTSMVPLNGGCRLRECNMGNLITDATLAYTKEFMKNIDNVHIACLQGGRIRSSIEHSGNVPFEVSRGDVISVLPFSGDLVILTIKGSTLLEALEHSVHEWRTVDTNGQFLQLSGMNVTYDLAKPPGSRVMEATAICSNCKEQYMTNVNTNYEYKIIMPKFLAEAGDGFTMFDNCSSVDLPYSELDCLIWYMNKTRPVNPKVTGHIILLNEDNLENKQSKSNAREPRLLNAGNVMFQSYLLIMFLYLIQFTCQQ